MFGWRSSELRAANPATAGERLRIAGVVLGRSLRVSAHALSERLTARARPAPGGVPLDRAAITPAWLTQALGAEHPGVRVRSVRPLDHTEGTTSRTRIELEYGRHGEVQLPSTMFVKMTPGLSHLLLLSGLGLIEGEVRFYQALRHEVPANAPEAFHIAYDPRSERFLMLLEDLVAKQVRFGHAPEPVERLEAEAVLEAMARYHAPLWGSPALDREYRWLPSPTRGRFHDFYRVVDMPLRGGIERAGSLLAPQLQDPGSVLDAYWRLQQANSDPPCTFLHGDPHLGNMYFEPGGEPGFLDWQLVRRGSWAHDVGYFLISALRVDERRRWEHELITHYVACLHREGIDALDEAEAWERYRLQPAHGLPMWLGTLALGDYQSERVCRLNVERFAAAATDLDTFPALQRWSPA